MLLVAVQSCTRLHKSLRLGTPAGIVKESQISSGLDVGKLGQQPGNRPAQTGEASEVMSFSGLLPETINGRAGEAELLVRQACGAPVALTGPVLCSHARHARSLWSRAWLAQARL